MKNKVLICMVLLTTMASLPSLSQTHRSTSAKHAFQYEHPCPSTGKTKGRCEGYVIDHIKPLACGGLDDPSNMQWQTVEEGKAKDKWERKDCELDTQ